ncbi:MAG: helix-turn-helix transcriptional regulator [Dysgonamonadaceae bacterium]|nr:helix-turn-helix transcriptional regulator [Dysgonamonadaceae bacterium]MDD4728806.1 helix-turn-helix transcriptional regulator [Dysgonamonadaceae bacterium]
MKDRIKAIMDNENLTPAKFADQLQINRAVISHILNGRNNPSLDVVTKILSEMQHISSDWLLNGIGPMYKEGSSSSDTKKEYGLFDVDATESTDNTDNSEYSKETIIKTPDIPQISTDNQSLQSAPSKTRKVKQIIVYYTDNTFETFSPH